MSRIVLIFLFWSLALEGLELELRAPSAILVDMETGAVLFEKDADSLRHPASTIKMLTALFILSQNDLDLDRKHTVTFEALRSISDAAKKKGEYKMPAHWLEAGLTKVLGLKVGETVSLRDLLHAHLILSAGDASNALAEATCGSIPLFVKKLNAFAKSIGCTSTHVMNPHGLPHPRQVTSARDLALIARKAFQNPIFREIVSTDHYLCQETNKSEAREIYNTNRLIRSGRYYYDKAIGGKTGFHSLAGLCLVAAAEGEGRSLISVVLKNKNRDESFRDTVKLFESAFKEKPVHLRVLAKGVQNFTRPSVKTSRAVPLTLGQDLTVQTYPSLNLRLQAECRWNPIDGSVQKGDLMGELVVLDQYKRTLAKAPLHAAEDVWPSLSIHVEHNLGKYIVLALILALSAFLYKRA